MPTRPLLSILKVAGRLKDLNALTWMLARCQPLLVLVGVRCAIAALLDVQANKKYISNVYKRRKHVSPIRWIIQGCPAFERAAAFL
jgi:hypothetical protein